LVGAGEAATTRPLGRVSEKATPASATVLAGGFVRVKVIVDVPPGGIDVGLKPLEMVGGATTTRVEVLETVPVPPSVEVTAPVVLSKLPADAPVTVTEKEQAGLVATVAPDSEMVRVVAVVVSVPPHTVELESATVRPVGRMSEKPTPVRLAALGDGFVIVNPSEDVPPSGIVDGLKAFAMVGGATTVRVAEELFEADPDSVAVTGPELFAKAPALVPFTTADTVQLAPAARVPPVRLTLDEPAVAVAVPPQVFDRLVVAFTTMPDGRESVKAIPLRLIELLFGLVINRLSVEVPFSGIDVGLKDLVMVGGLTTVTEAVAVLPVRPPASVADTLPDWLVTDPD
jgi:hypothetical protein